MDTTVSTPPLDFYNMIFVDLKCRRWGHLHQARDLKVFLDILTTGTVLEHVDMVSVFILTNHKLVC